MLSIQRREDLDFFTIENCTIQSRSSVPVNKYQLGLNIYLE